VALAGLARRRALLVAGFGVAVTVGAFLLRFLAAPGSDLDPAAQRLLGRSPRLDAYWYTRTAIDLARGDLPAPMPRQFDRPVYTAYCHAVYALVGTSDNALPVPAMLAGAATVGLIFLVGLKGGFSPTVAGLAALFAATDWIAVLHDREPLIYSTVNVGLLLAVLLWLLGLARPTLFAAGWATLAVTVAGLKETALLALPGFVAGQIVAAGSPRRRRVVVLVGSAAAAAAALAAWVLAPDAARAFLHKLSARSVLPSLSFPRGWIAAFADLPQSLAVVGRFPAVGVLAFVGLVAVLLEGKTETLTRDAVFRRFLAAWLLGGALIVAGFAYRPTRYLLCLFPPAFLLAAHGAAVLAGRVSAPVRRGHRWTTVILFLAWWLGLAALWSFVQPLLPQAVLGWLPAALATAPGRFAGAAFAAALIAAYQGPTLSARARVRPAARYAVALVVFVFLTDGRNLYAQLSAPTYNDQAAQQSFAAIVGPGARVQGYAAYYLAVARGRRPVFDFSLRPQDLAANPSRSTHIVTLWIPELDYVERLMAERHAPLAVVADLVIEHERYRVYRRFDAAASGYRLTPFERARELESDDTTGAAAAYREIVAGGHADPAVLAYAGAAIARVAPVEGRRLLEKAVVLAPGYAIAYLKLADLLDGEGDRWQANAWRTEGAALLPHELILGFGPPPG
jgi:hypothetical protein